MTAMKKRQGSGSVKDLAQRQQALEQAEQFVSSAGSTLPNEKAGGPKAAFPWEMMDDKVMRTQGYTVNFPASVYAKLKFLGENLPGGPSVRTMVLEALEPYIAERLKKITASN